MLVTQPPLKHIDIPIYTENTTWTMFSLHYTHQIWNCFQYLCCHTQLCGCKNTTQNNLQKLHHIFTTGENYLLMAAQLPQSNNLIKKLSCPCIQSNPIHSIKGKDQVVKVSANHTQPPCWGGVGGVIYTVSNICKDDISPT